MSASIAGVGCKSGAVAASTSLPETGTAPAAPCNTLPPLAQKSSYTIGFVQIFEPGNPWTEANSADIVAQAEKHGHTLIFEPPKVAGAEEEVARMKKVVDAKVDAIVLRPLDSTSLVPAVLAARAACIPVFTINRFLDSSQATAGKDYVTGIGADGVVQGQMIGDWLAKNMAGHARIIELEGTPGASSAVGRKKGFEERIAQEPGMHIFASKTANYDRHQGHDVAKDMLARCPDCNAIYAHNDNMALGALAALRELGKTPGKDVIVVSVDGLKEAVQDIIDGSVGATLLNEPRFGAITFSTIEKYGQGRKIDPMVSVKGPLIDRTNAVAMLPDAI
jgi:ribose transport system substrate-binding protein